MIEAKQQQQTSFKNFTRELLTQLYCSMKVYPLNVLTLSMPNNLAPANLYNA